MGLSRPTRDAIIDLVYVPCVDSSGRDFAMDVTVQSVQSMLTRLSAEDLKTASKFIQFLLENHTEARTPLTSDHPQTTDQSKEEAIAELRSLCHPGKHVWTEDPANYIRRMRDEDRF